MDADHRVMRLRTVLAASVLVVGACSDGAEGATDRGAADTSTTALSAGTSDASSTSTTTTEPPTTSSESPTTSTTASRSASRSERPATGGRAVGGLAGRLTEDGTPVFLGDFADPFVLVADGSFYAYATNTRFTNVPVIRVSGGGQGEYVGEVLPELPAWTEEGHVWAPSVAPVGDGYVLYYSTRHTASGRQCISAAVGPAPEGPFVDETTGPLVCDLDQGGSIDPSPFRDADGSLWLLWKSDGNCCGWPTKIYAEPLAGDGLTSAGEPVELIRNDLGWERDVVEGPSMILIDGGYHLFYSANRWDTADYAVGHALCESVTGPCEKDGEPWLGTYDEATGPGGLEVIELPERVADFVVYHGWTDGEVGYENGQRSLYVAPIRWVDGQPVLINEL